MKPVDPYTDEEVERARQLIEYGVEPDFTGVRRLVAGIDRQLAEMMDADRPRPPNHHLEVALREILDEAKQCSETDARRRKTFAARLRRIAAIAATALGDSET